MQKTVGLWIDHRKAFIVTLSDKGEATKLILSDVENPRGSFTGEGPGKSVESRLSGSEAKQEKDYTGHLGLFYKSVFESIKFADTILIMGPGEAKGEMKKYMESNQSRAKVETVETEDKMTDPQIIAKVHRHFQPADAKK
jgi:hypothetical protein